MTTHIIPNDPLTRVLYIDLSKLKFWITPRPELFEAAMGGSGVAIRLLMEECPAGADPLGPENPIIFAIGPLVGYYPLASKTVAMFKSPHTGNLGESHAGGRSAVAIRMAGYGAIVIRGRSEHPIFIEVDGDRVHFRDATALWGMRNSFATGSVLRQLTPGSGIRTIMRIGRAGEKQISYASVITETYRHFGRLGLGAVFGSKNLKALVVTGRRSLAVADRPAFRTAYDEIFKTATESSLMKKYHQLGTPVNVQPLNAIGGLPTRNLQSGQFEGAEAISGESLAANYLGRRVACAHCPVACIHLAAIRLPYPNDPYFYKTVMVGYDHELIYAIGSLLGIGDPVGMLQVMDEIEVQGLDAISTGVCLAWATEALEKKLITLQDTDGLALKWGDFATYMEAVKRIVSQPTDLYKAMAHGSDHAASIYGGAEFSLAFGGNEMPGYHTGPGCYLGYATGARHSHLDSAGYSLDQKVVGKKDAVLTPDGVADSLLEEERWRQVLTSLTICLFARNIYTPETIIKALAALGSTWTAEDFTRVGVETLRLKYEFKVREGFDPAKLQLPDRIYETPSPAGPFDESFMRQAIARYNDQVHQ
ncbi:MAG TPA: aldehyde ferredoxin oxidoreductase family protein [Anaerolineaceae bacterium]|nr:aldehyde ferredoxin oxidoreductase family protein [Anaerolineaceae bacterium]HPN50601.1 aldehyde ferredoxin oxidoreductase family protein [Anaerolineaceae bacterium]